MGYPGRSYPRTPGPAEPCANPAPSGYSGIRTDPGTLCDIKQEWAEGGKDKIAKGYARLVAKEKMTQEKVDGILASITPGLKEDLCKDCDLIVEAAFEDMQVKKTTFAELDKSVFSLQIHHHFQSQRLETDLHVH